MKHLSISLILLCISLPALYSQDSLVNTQFYPQQKDLGITLNLSGAISNITGNTNKDLQNASTFLMRYKVNDQWTFRVGIAPVIYNYRRLQTDSIGKDLVEFDSTARRSSVSIRPGIEYHVTGTKRLDPYMAFDAEFGAVGRFKAGSSTNTTDTTGTGRLTRTITEDGGYAFGAKLSAGMNYYVSRKLFFGLEYGMGLAYLSSGGDRQAVTRFEPVSGTATTVRKLGSARTNDLDFLVDPTVQITFGYFFSL